MSLRPATTEEIKKIKGTNTQVVSSSEINTIHPSYNKLRISTPTTGVQNSNIQKETEKSGILKSLIGAPITMLARPVQAVAQLSGVEPEKIEQVSKKLSGGLIAPMPQDFSDVKKDIGRGIQTVGFGLAPVSGGAALGIGTSLEQGNKLLSKETALQTGVGMLGGKLFDIVGKPLLSATGKVIGTITPKTIQEVTAKGAKAVSDFATRHGIAPTGESAIVKSIEQKANVPFDMLKKGAIGAKNTLVKEYPSLGKIGTLKPKSSDILNRINKLDASDARKFKEQFKETPGEYLEKVGNFNDPEKTVLEEARAFSNSLQQVDDALDSLPGVYKTKELGMMADDLVARENRIGVPGKDTARIRALKNKHDTIGLTMKETNELKRLYERNVKTGYLNDRNTEGVTRATNLDELVREWQIGQADKLGFKNLRELNKQTQKSKFIINKLGKKLSTEAQKNDIDLGDLILLSGGDMNSIAMFLTKKTIGSKPIRAAIAKRLSTVPPQPRIQAEFGGKRGLPALIPKRDYRTTIELPAYKKPKNNKTVIEPRAKIVNRSSSLPDTRLLPPPPSGTTIRSGETIRLPKNAREEYMGVMTSKPVSQQSPQVVTESYTNSISNYSPEVQKFIQNKLKSWRNIDEIATSAANADNLRGVEEKFYEEYLKNLLKKN